MTTVTEIQKGTRRTISGTVRNPREIGGHYKIDLQGTGWTQDRFTVTAFEVAGPDTFAALPASREITIVVEAERIRDNKDGSRERDWFWRIVGPSNGAAPAAEPAPAPTDESRARKAAALAPDPRGNSIERQVALIQANLLAINGLIAPDSDHGIVDTVEAAADRYIAWLQGPTAPDTGGEPSPASTVEGRGEPEPQIDESQPPTDVDELPF